MILFLKKTVCLRDWQISFTTRDFFQLFIAINNANNHFRLNLLTLPNARESIISNVRLPLLQRAPKGLAYFPTITKYLLYHDA